MVERSVALESQMRTSYLDYAMSVIVSRALPDVRDGLKPVQRRVLYAMYDLGMRNNSPYRKSARVVGDVIAKYHPHGDSAVYDALVRLAQPFSLRYPLVDGQGNFGSVDKDPPAAMRYTEARLTSIADEMLADIDRQTVAFQENFDGSEREPVVLPARLPNLLINGTTGIAVGMATEIQPHNLTEVCDAILFAISRWQETPQGGEFEASLEELLEFIKGPDFPTAGIIRGTEGVRRGYATGQGKVIVEARAEIQDLEGRGQRSQIVVTELPYQVNKASLVEKMAELVRGKRLDGISEIRDESDRDGMRIVIELRRDAAPDIVLNNLYEQTQMRHSLGINTRALVDGQPLMLPLKQIIFHFIRFRREVVINRTRYELRRAQDRAHVLEGLRIALDHLDEVITVIRNAESADAARITLIERYILSQRQAQAILDMQLRRLAALERQAILDELEELRSRIAELEGVLGDPGRITTIVREEIEELKEKHGDERRTEIDENELGALRREDLIPHQDVIVTISSRGYIKRVLASAYRRQHRGGRGITGVTTREEDIVQHLLVCDTHDTLLFFTNRGRVTTLRCFDLPAEASRTARGIPVANLFQGSALAPNERVTTVMATSDLSEHDYLVFATRKGEVKRTPLERFVRIRSTGKKAMDLEEGDDLVSVILAKEEDQVILVTEQGLAIRFPISPLRAASAVSGGVRGIRFGKRGTVDNVVAAVIAEPEKYLFVITAHGYGKSTRMGTGETIETPQGPPRTDGYPIRNRGGMGVATFKVRHDRHKNTGLIVGLAAAARDEEIMLISRKGIVIRTTLRDVRPSGRDTSGVHVMRLEQDDEVVAIAQFPEPDKSEPAAPAPQLNGRANSRANGSAPAQPQPEAQADPDGQAETDAQTEDTAELPEDTDQDAAAEEDIVNSTEDVVDEDTDLTEDADEDD